MTTKALPLLYAILAVTSALAVAATLASVSIILGKPDPLNS